MKKLLLAGLALAAVTSCQEQSFVDTGVPTEGNAINFAPYAGASVTKGTPVTTNTLFQAGAFEVAATSNASAYFGFSTVKYDAELNSNQGGWVNQDDMFWPNKDANLWFGAYWPSTATFPENGAPALTAAVDAGQADKFNPEMTFDYVVGQRAEQVDLMFALTKDDYIAPTSGNNDNPEEDKNKSINLYFKHALTQIAFTATKDDDIEVEVTKVEICNVVDNGVFKATESTVNLTGGVTDDGLKGADGVTRDNFCTWTPAIAAAVVGQGSGETNLTNYVACDAAAPNAIAVNSATEPTELLFYGENMGTQFLMLLPQTLTAWNPTASAPDNNVGTESYLAITCTITHAEIDDNTTMAPIADGVVFIPFDTKGIDYDGDKDFTDDADAWLPGYKITYNLHFGGGYISTSDQDDVPNPGEVPDPSDVINTLRAITYNAIADEWIPVAGDEIELGGTTTVADPA